MTRALATAVLLVWAGAAGAQDDPPEGGRRGRPREEIFRMVDSYLAHNLKERLALSDEQLSRALPLVRRLHADRRRFAERRIRALQPMRRMVRAGSIDDARAADLLKELKTAEAEEAAALRAGQDALDAVLTPAQQVKYRILEEEIEHRMRQVMERVRGERRDAPGGRRRNEAPRPPPPDPR